MKKKHFIISALLLSEFIPLTQTMFWSIHEYRKWIHIYTNMCISTHSHKSLGIYIITESVHHIFCIRYFVLVSIDCLWYILYKSINFIDIIIVSIHLSVKFSKHNTQHIHFVLMMSCAVDIFDPFNLLCTTIGHSFLKIGTSQRRNQVLFIYRGIASDVLFTFNIVYIYSLPCSRV